MLVSCAAHSAMALQVLAEIAQDRPETPLVVLYGGQPGQRLHGSAFEAGAEGRDRDAEPPQVSSLSIEKAIARRRGAEPGCSLTDDRGARPEGRHRQDADVYNLAVRSRSAARAVIVDIDLQFGDVGSASGSVRTRRSSTSRRRRALDAEKVDELRDRTSFGRSCTACSDAARSGCGRHDIVPAATFSRSSGALRLRDRRHRRRRSRPR